MTNIPQCIFIHTTKLLHVRLDIVIPSCPNNLLRLLKLQHSVFLIIFRFADVVSILFRGNHLLIYQVFNEGIFHGSGICQILFNVKCELELLITFKEVNLNLYRF